MLQAVKEESSWIAYLSTMSKILLFISLAINVHIIILRHSPSTPVATAAADVAALAAYGLGPSREMGNAELDSFPITCKIKYVIETLQHRTYCSEMRQSAVQYRGGVGDVNRGKEGGGEGG